MNKKAIFLMTAAVLLTMLFCSIAMADDDVTEYDVWLGNTRVTSANKDDILSDGGKAKYDPDTHTLTLNAPSTIRGAHSIGTYTHDGTDYDKTCKIYSKGDLTVTGGYWMWDNDYDYCCGICVEGTLNLYECSLLFVMGYIPMARGADVTGDINILTSSYLTADTMGDVGSLGIYCGGCLTLTDDSDGVEMCGETSCWLGDFSLSDKLYTIDPEQITFEDHTIKNAAGNSVSGVRINSWKYFDLWVGDRQVTTYNMDDVLDDGGKVKYDPDTCTLTLNNPTISGSHHEDSYLYEGERYYKSCLIYSEGDLTIRGEYTRYWNGIDYSEYYYGIYVEGSLTIDGDIFVDLGFCQPLSRAVEVTGDLHIQSGNLTAIAEEIGSYGVYCPGNVTFGIDATALGMRGGTSCWLGSLSLPDHLNIYTPEDGIFEDHTIKKPDGAPANDAWITDKIRYHVSVGSWEVTSYNAEDIFNDGGSATFDPDTRTLTLDNAEIYGSYSTGNFLYEGIRYDQLCNIYSKGDLTIIGSYAMNNGEYYRGIYVDGSLTLDGDYQFLAGDDTPYARAVEVTGDLTVRSGSLAGRAKGAESYGVYCSGCVTLGSGADSLEMSGATSCRLGSLSVPDRLYISVPEDGTFEDHTIKDKEGNPVSEAVIDDTAYYPLWVGSEHVTGHNMNDILQDGGSAKYDPDTRTLTLNNPAISGSHSFGTFVYQGTGYNRSCMICCEGDLTVRGVYAMNDGEYYRGIYVDGSLILDGNFRFLAGDGVPQAKAVEATGSISMLSGSLHAAADGSNSRGVSCSQGFTAGTNVKRIRMEGDTSCWLGSLTLANGEYIMTPEGGRFDNHTFKDAAGDPVSTASIDFAVTVGSAADWEELADYLESGLAADDLYVKQTADISVSRMLGGTRFQGVYDGGGHTLDVSLVSTSGAAAPFRGISNATIRNLKVTGSVYGPNHSSGLVAGADGTNLIENCVIATGVGTSGTHCGGVIGHGGTAAVTIRGCVYSGTISDATHAGTFWGWSDSGANPVIESCLDVSDAPYPIGLGFPDPGNNIINTYYLNTDKPKGASRVWTNRGIPARAVLPGADVTLDFGTGTVYGVSGITVYENGLSRGGVRYAAEGDTVDILSITSPLTDRFTADGSELAASDSGWTVTLPAGNVIIYTRIKPDFFSTGDGSAAQPYVIRNASEWEQLSELFADTDHILDIEGQYFRLGANISVSGMLGTESKPFDGIFDGYGHTLEFNANNAPDDCAPFKYIRNAVISNLHISGTIQTAHRWAAGLVANSIGTVAITNCRSSVVIRSSVTGDGTHAGFISVMKAGSSVTMTGCVFDGAITGSDTTFCGGFVGYARGSLTIRNSISAPSAFETLKSQNFSRWVDGTEITIENSYYMNASVNSQGIRGYGVVADEGITAEFGEAATYGVSGITAYPVGLRRDGVFYAGEGENVTVTILEAGGRPFGVLGAALQPADGGWSLTMPAGEVRILCFFEPDFTMPAGLAAIGESAFEGAAMTAVDAHNCTSIGRDAFRDCVNLAKIWLPKDCEIDEDAFFGCGTVYVFAEAGGSSQTFCDEKDNLILVH